MSDTDRGGMYPLDQLRDVIEALPQFRALDLRIVELDRGSCVLRLDYDERFVGNPDTGTIHGGVITTLLDSAGGVAAFSSIANGQTVATLDLRIDYLRPATTGSAVHGRAVCYRLTRTVAFVRGVAYHDDPGDPIANCTACFMIGSVGFSAGAA